MNTLQNLVLIYDTMPDLNKVLFERGGITPDLIQKACEALEIEFTPELYESMALAYSVDQKKHIKGK